MPGSKCPHGEQPPVGDPRELVAKYLNEFFIGSQSSSDILTPVTNSDNLLDNIPLIGFLLFPVLFLWSSISASWVISPKSTYINILISRPVSGGTQFKTEIQVHANLTYNTSDAKIQRGKDKVFGQ